MPNKSIPTIGDSNWGTPLNNHLSQLQNSTTGGINTWTNSTSRPSGLTADDQGKTGINLDTGLAEQWDGSEFQLITKNIIKVNSINELRNLKPSTIGENEVFVKTYYNFVDANGLLYNDLGGGEFYFEANSSLNDNSGTIFKPNSTTANGRWIRKIVGGINYFGSIETSVSKVIYASWFGVSAKNNSVDNRSLLQQCLDYGGDGGVTMLPPGQIKLSGGITTKPNSRLEGLTRSIGGGGNEWNSNLYWESDSINSNNLVGIMAGSSSEYNNLSLFFDYNLWLYQNQGSGTLSANSIGIESSGVYNGLAVTIKINNVYFDGWNIGYNLKSGYYNTLTNCEFRHCNIAIQQFDANNLNLYGLSILAKIGIKSIRSTSVGPINIWGGAIEGFESGIIPAEGETWNVNGVYWESSDESSSTVTVIDLTSKNNICVNIQGSHVTMKGIKSFVDITNSSNISLNSYGNKFTISKPTKPGIPSSHSYRFMDSNPSTLVGYCTINIFGDKWTYDNLEIDLNAKYIDEVIFTGGMSGSGNAWSVKSPQAFDLRFSPQVKNIFDISSMGNPAISFPLSSSNPTNKIKNSIHLADGVSWNPLLIIGSTPYLVFWNGAIFTKL